MFGFLKKKEVKIHEEKPLHFQQELKMDAEKQIEKICDDLYEKHGILVTRVKLSREDFWSGDSDQKFPSTVKHKVDFTFEI